MTGEGVHVLHQDRASFGRRRAAHAAAERNAHTGRFALKGPDNETAVLQKIKAGPVQVRQDAHQQCRCIREIGRGIALADKQRVKRLQQRGVYVVLRCVGRNQG